MYNLRVLSFSELNFFTDQGQELSELDFSHQKYCPPSHNSLHIGEHTSILRRVNRDCNFLFHDWTRCEYSLFAHILWTLEEGSRRQVVHQLRGSDSCDGCFHIDIYLLHHRKFSSSNPLHPIPPTILDRRSTYIHIWTLFHAHLLTAYPYYHAPSSGLSASNEIVTISHT